MRKLKGVVVSDKMTGTAVVRVERLKVHPVYKKRYRATTKFAVSDPGNQLKVGDLVEIVETRPISKKVHFQVSQVMGRSEEVAKKLTEAEEEKKEQEETEEKE